MIIRIIGEIRAQDIRLGNQKVGKMILIQHLFVVFFPKQHLAIFFHDIALAIVFRDKHLCSGIDIGSKPHIFGIRAVIITGIEYNVFGILRFEQKVYRRRNGRGQVGFPNTAYLYFRKTDHSQRETHEKNHP
ncbi:hypothetical protein SDC9_155231 [bioreactor metagenome]|uniref:Uncharacterized protein n=1 Tax=bioreactor metagenome TaxID=1076179 RepID=A0A645F2V4_9ZZZZ